MRKGLSFIIVSTVILATTACNNKLNVLAPYKNITVVYGLMDQSDTAHYIRVNKAFLGNGNAYTMASQFDSSYYPANQLSVQLLCFNSQGTQSATINLTADSSIPLPPGTFSYPKQILYKTKAKLNQIDNFGGSNTYELVVTNKKTKDVVTGSTQLLPDVTFTDGLNGTQLIINSSSTNPTALKWYSTTGARIYQLTIRFWYYQKTSTASGEQYLDWVFAPETAGTLQGGQNMEYTYNQQAFFQLVKTSVPIIPGVYRKADSMSVVFTSGSDDFNTYIQLSQPSLGIDQDVPSFSDVKNGIGIYTSRHTQIITKQVYQQVYDTLVNGSDFTQYGFQN